jgi:protein-tyrosine phosphatase
MLLGVQFIDTAVQAGQRVLVHCKMGIGRSPTMIAAYFVWKGQTVNDAIRQVEGTRRIVGPVVSRVALNKLAAWLKQKSQG